MKDSHCWVCGVYRDNLELDGAHVKSKNQFSEDEISEKLDRERNIIFLCKKHHSLFDNKKGLGIAKIESEYYFTRINHCTEGICATKSKVPIINEFLLRLGKEDCGLIKPEYISWKNERLAILGHRQFVIDPNRHWSPCDDPTEN